MDRKLEYRRLRAPRAHGELLIEPPLSDLARVVEENCARRKAYDYDFQGKSLRKLSDEARREALQMATRYTRSYRDVPDELLQKKRFFMAGHQPDLFHPGVWIKNFMLGRLAQSHDAVPINLIIDNDICRRTSILVPTGSTRLPRSVAVSYDRSHAPIPYEQRRLIDREQFESFATRVGKTIRPLVEDPLIDELWPLAIERSRSNENLGLCLAQARHCYEELWGSLTLELPISLMCHVEAFWWLTAHFLAQLPRIWEIYNSSIHQYREIHHIRSSAHPVPDLASENQWLEAPWWIYNEVDPTRRKLFVRCSQDKIWITNRVDLEIPLQLDAEGDAHSGVRMLKELDARGIKLRPRALITTMFARLFLSDLFIHGIGGAKYDQLCDMMIARIFNIRPPAFVVMSATAHLPIERKPVSPMQVADLQRQFRDFEFNPQRQIDLATIDDPAQRSRVESIISRRQSAIDSLAESTDRSVQHRSIVESNRQLQPLVAARRKKNVQSQSDLAVSIRSEQLLASREYSFCLFPKKTLSDLLLDFSLDSS